MRSKEDLLKGFDAGNNWDHERLKFEVMIDQRNCLDYIGRWMEKVEAVLAKMKLY